VQFGMYRVYTLKSISGVVWPSIARHPGWRLAGRQPLEANEWDTTAGEPARGIGDHRDRFRLAGGSGGTHEAG
jgi:hypothetical protein